MKFKSDTISSENSRFANIFVQVGLSNATSAGKNNVTAIEFVTRYNGVGGHKFVIRFNAVLSKIGNSNIPGLFI